MRKLYKPCSVCDNTMEYSHETGKWVCPECGFVRTRHQSRIPEVGIRWGRGFEDRDWLHTSGMRDYLDYQERTGKRHGVDVKVKVQDE